MKSTDIEWLNKGETAAYFLNLLAENILHLNGKKNSCNNVIKDIIGTDSIKHKTFLDNLDKNAVELAKFILKKRGYFKNSFLI